MSTVERGFAHIIKDLGGNKRSWESAPPWVSDGSKYVPYLYSRDESKKCYRVQVGLVGAVIYDTGVTEFYDPELKEVRVKGEEWEVWSADKKATLNPPITWGAVENNAGVYITRKQTTSKPDGLLEIVYGFIVGASLKHTVTWISSETAAVTVQVKQIHLMDFDKVTTDTGISMSSKSEKSTGYLFGYGSKNFWLFENQYAMVIDTKNLTPNTLLTEKCLQTGEIDFSGKKVTYTFGDWTLTTGQSLVIDPDTATLSDPTQDGYIEHNGGYFRDSAGAEILVGSGNPPPPVEFTGRGYIEWNVSSIPDGAIITDTVFKYHGVSNSTDCHIHAMAAAPSGATDANLYADIADGTVYYDVAGFPVAGTNKEADLGATADSDLQGLLASDWFAIGIQSDDETSPLRSYICSEAYATPTPPPTLYVEYSLPAVGGGLMMTLGLKGHMGYDLKTRGGKARRRIF